MTCKTCGGTAFDSDGICLACGTRNASLNGTQPKTPIPVASPAAMTAPEPTPEPLRAGSRPLHADPAATNPGSGVFCGHCGSAVDPQSDYCGICGYPLRAGAAQRAHQSQAQHLPPMMPTAMTPARADVSSSAAPFAPPRIPPSARWVLISSVVVALLVIGIMFGLLVVHRH
jgi:hypothetical protein